MKLIDTRDGTVYVDFPPNKTPVFASEFLEKEMRVLGVEIPLDMSESFGGKRVVLLRDKDFARAFREVYYLYNIDRDVFAWKD